MVFLQYLLYIKLTISDFSFFLLKSYNEQCISYFCCVIDDDIMPWFNIVHFSYVVAFLLSQQATTTFLSEHCIFLQCGLLAYKIDEHMDFRV